VPPQYALGHKVESSMLGTSDELDALQAEIGAPSD
jgi:hypothetical protein